LLQEVLGLAARRVLYEVSAAVLAGDAHRCLELVAEAAQGGRDINRLSRDLVEHFRNLLVARLAGAKSGSSAPLLDLPDQEIGDLTAQSRAVSVETLLDYFDFMAAGDEEVGRSPTPRFVLESVLVRLAALPQTLPVGQLIERLERLEVSPPALRGQVSSAPSKDTIAPPRAAAPPVETPPATRSADSWPDFVAAVGRAKKFLASHLDSAQPLELPPGRLRIGVTERYDLAFLLDGDNLASLREEAKKFFAQEVNVQIVNMVADTTDSRDPAAASSALAEARSPMVNEALRIFGGSVRNVRRE
jgi:hypothetical protein